MILFHLLESRTPPGHLVSLTVKGDTHLPDAKGTGCAASIALSHPSIGYSGTLVKVHMVEVQLQEVLLTVVG